MCKIYTVAIIGAGGRGGDAYGNIIHTQKDKFKIVALCDLKKERMERFGEKFGVAAENRFTDENEFFAVKRADVLVIATQDKDHVRQAVKAFSLGYDVLLEKPISSEKDELEKLIAAQKKYGKKALVCHVLRYAPAFMKAAELIDEGAIGKLVAINALERVTFWHQAHSYVRGNWRKAEDTSPMIMAKCCHDLDLLQYYAGAKCKTISSVGDIAFFKRENAPEGCAERCVNCKYKDSCSYSAKKIYLDWWVVQGKKEDVWPFNIIAEAPLTQEKIEKAIETGPYGRCVFACDNDVVDHQIVEMQFENGVKAELTMTGFTKLCGRRITFFGTQGNITLDESENKIMVDKFTLDENDSETIQINVLNENGYGHGGGDYGIVNTLYDILEGKTSNRTSLEESVESHLMAIAAEESRVQGGKLIEIHK